MFIYIAIDNCLDNKLVHGYSLLGQYQIIPMSQKLTKRQLRILFYFFLNIKKIRLPGVLTILGHRYVIAVFCVQLCVSIEIRCFSLCL